MAIGEPFGPVGESVNVSQFAFQKVLPGGLEPGVACLFHFSSETDGLPGLELAENGLLAGGFERIKWG